MTASGAGRVAETAAGPRPSTVVAITFPWGRYHATPWRRNVNEAAVDWPPSPWRLLRALYASWRWHYPDLAPEVVEPVLGRLVAPPRFRLPPSTVAHTRHYLPGVKHRPGVSTDTDKTLDTFVVVERGARLLIEWPVSLTSAEREVLGQLCEALAYLGRAESITEAQLVNVDETLPEDGWIDEHATVLSEDDSAGGGASADVLGAADPLDLDSLVLLPHQVRNRRQLVPGGTRWLRYPAPAAVPSTVSRRSRPQAAARTRPMAIRLAITGAALPPETAALAVGDLLHQTMCKRLLSPTLSGKSAADVALRGHHGHAHYLPYARDPQDRLLDTVLVWAPDGFDVREVEAFATASIKLRAPNHVAGVRGRTLTVEAVGAAAAVAPEVTSERGANRWVSATPYLPVRHAGRNQALLDLLLEDVRRELEYRDLPTVVRVSLREPPGGSWRAFRRHRTGQSIGTAQPGHGLVIDFAEPVSGPLALGRLSHFGLGLFRPLSEGRADGGGLGR